MRRFIWIAVLGISFLLAGCGGDEITGLVIFDNTPPPSPQNLRVDKIRDGEIWLSWERVQVEEVAFYIVYRSEGGQESVAMDTTLVNTFRDRGLDYETEYTYHVTAVSQSGIESERSSSVSGQPFNNLSPLAPMGLRAVAHNITILNQLDILLDWDENAEADLSVYRVYRSTEPNFAIDAENLMVVVEEPSYVDRDIEVGVLYYYRVTAVDRGAKESAPSEIIADVALPPPELMEPVSGELTSSTPTFRWHPVPHALNYRVVVTTSPTSGEISAMPLTRETAAVFAGRPQLSGDSTNLQSGQIYYWRVIASTREDGTENSVSQVERFKIKR